jgi:succinoglycan biosynthesis transport protein ExoP
MSSNEPTSQDPTQHGAFVAPGQSQLFFAPMGMEPAQPDHDDDDDVDLRHYVDVLRKRLWLIVVGVIVGVAVTFGWTLRQPKLYRATATVIIDTQTANVLGRRVDDVVALGTGGYWANETFYNKEYTVMRSRAVAARVAEKLDLLHDDEHNGLAVIEDSVEREEARAQLDPANLAAGRYTVEPTESQNVVSLTAVSQDPDFAADLANAAAESYAELNLDKRVEGMRDASTWLEVQHSELKGKLESSEDKLYRFMENNEVLNASLQSQLDEVMQRLNAFNGRLAQTQAERIQQEINAQALRDARANNALLDTIPEIRDAPVIAALKTRLVELAADRSELTARYLPAHPKVQSVDDQIELVRSNLATQIDAVLVSLERRQATLANTESGLKRAIAEERQREARLNKLMLDYQRLRREVDTNSRLYELVATRRKETDLSGALKLNNVSILDRARAPLVPFKPNLQKNVALGGFLGVLLAALLALGLDLLDNSLKTQEDVERLKAPFLGLMPVIESAKVGRGKGDDLQATNQRDLYVMHNPKSSPAECARFIRTNLLFMSPDKPLQNFLVTSAGPQEGKTTTAISLAVTMAQSGSRTLIVDTDMRRPRLHRAFGVSNDTGLSSAIVGEARLEDAIQATDAQDLDVLVCGPIPPNPAELLHTEAFKDIVAKLNERYDRIIFDSPPVGAVTDPVVLGTHLDGAVVVLKAHRTSKEAGKQTLRALRDANVHILGAVLNDVDLSSKRYGGGYYAYYRKYGYYYGEKPATGEA